MPSNSFDVTLADNDSSPICKHFQTGFCKFRDQCRRRHETAVCKSVICPSKTCKIRHPKMCKFFAQNQFCKFGENCCYRHTTSTPQDDTQLSSLLKKVEEMDQTIKSLQSEVLALKSSTKCDQCDFVATSSTTLKTHITKKHKTVSPPPLERTRNQVVDTSLNLSLPCGERSEDSESESEDAPTSCEWYYCNFEATPYSNMTHHIQEEHTITSSFVYPDSNEKILCDFDENCEEEFFLDHTFAMHVYNIHHCGFKCDHCFAFLPGSEEMEAIHLKMCSSPCTGKPNCACSY